MRLFHAAAVYECKINWAFLSAIAALHADDDDGAWLLLLLLLVVRRLDMMHPPQGKRGRAALNGCCCDV